MTTDTASITDPVNAADSAHHDAHNTPTDKKFVQVAILLAAITAVEVAWSYLPWGEATGLKAVAEVGGLLAMMVWKFIVVAGTFMHLKFDNKILTRIFYAGLLLAVFVYIAALTTFRIW